MKKTYQIPMTDIIRVETQQMIADSFNGQGGSGQTNDGYATGDGLSRRGGSMWDDED